MVQEYGRYFGMKTCCLRGGCLTGPNHSGVELHGFLSYLDQMQCRRRGSTRFSATRASRCATTSIRSTWRASSTPSVEKPRCGEVYNIGGGRANSVSILEAFDRIAAHCSGKKMNYEYVDQNRDGDHICYISDLTKMRAHYPVWSITEDARRHFS